MHSSWALPTLRPVLLAAWLCVVLRSVVEENVTLYLDGSREEGNRVSAGPLKSWSYFSPVLIFLLLFLK